MRPLLATNQIGLGIQLNICFVVNYRWTFQSIIDHLGTLILSVNHNGASLCLQSRLYPGYVHAQYVTLCLGTGFQNRNYRVEYGIVTECQCIPVQNSTHYTPRFNEVDGGYTGITLSVCPSVRLWTESCPLCIFKNTHCIHFIFAHFIKQLQKVCCV